MPFVTCHLSCYNRISRQKLLRRLRREIDTLRALDGCPSSIAFEGAFETEGHVYLIMEVCHGGDLETLLKVRCRPLGTPHCWLVEAVLGCLACKPLRTSTARHCSPHKMQKDRQQQTVTACLVCCLSL